ncbi:hypothetical protein H0H81_006359 [Sphagnurus paluster]|uniref:Uncharacterized protein n=1 Tax=Sphagnurus paluster TaxID=117069 RepID=A0A9P7K3N1_9AGAR|nr:hypothetical protein H0H81_006359 [Sphagnurus paluster]
MVQSTLLAALDKGKNKNKRALTLENGDHLDLTSCHPTGRQPPTKRARISTAAPAAPEASTSAVPGPSAASTKAEEKKRKIFDRLKKECKSDAVKFQGSPKTIKIEEVYTEAEFDLLFKGKGLLIQPTPENKPKSVVTIIHFNSLAHIQSFFGDELKPLKGNHWTRGGLPSRSFGGGFFGGGFGSSTFSKSVKTGAVDVSIRSFEVNYSKNNMKCSLKFDVSQTGGDYDYDSDY